MKIIQYCPVCNTTQESYHDWEDLEDFYAADLAGDLDEPEFPHDEGNRDCGGSLQYSEAKGNS